eukprot:CAMPEP_0201552130 /NCGR_PEP_ID=MMETSP0173_2-20130828/14513_1 /ASSEMBLY_ACC=CAM_ASM_000268 /TAXON_ID=218659 /ORGANISM="Vexillifera sp., Strain DIVA3 564/2" /LENGTH=225 /DNA_ID=CAMNT_0047962557 /DNA_START=1 /DNA_END=675 /DNA_ORIENTATION=-
MASNEQRVTLIISLDGSTRSENALSSSLHMIHSRKLNGLPTGKVNYNVVLCFVGDGESQREQATTILERAESLVEAFISHCGVNQDDVSIEKRALFFLDADLAKSLAENSSDYCKTVANALLELASEIGAKALVMGTGSVKRKLKTLLIGSTSKHVVNAGDARQCDLYIIHGSPKHHIYSDYYAVGEKEPKSSDFVTNARQSHQDILEVADFKVSRHRTIKQKMI